MPGEPRPMPTGFIASLALLWQRRRTEAKSPPYMNWKIQNSKSEIRRNLEPRNQVSDRSPLVSLFGILLLLLLATQASIISAQPQESGSAARDRVTTRIGTNRVSITITGGERVIAANGLPDHTPGEFPRRGNPNTISAQDYHFQVPFHPQIAAQPRRANGAWFGVALNGVPFEPGTAEFWNGEREWNYEAKSGFI